MPRRILFILPVLLIGIAHQSRAATTACAQQLGSAPIGVGSTTEVCNQLFSNVTATLDWASVLPSTAATVTSGSISGSIDGDNFTITSSDQFEGANNTDLAWNGSAWVQAFSVNPNINTYGGQFNSTTQPNGPPPEGPFGDDLLGIIEPGGASNANTTANITFQQTLGFVEFEVTDASGSNNTTFTAQLIAKDSNGNTLGTYQVIDTGGGGMCPGLNNSFGPQPCNDAPILQFYSAADNIASVELIMSSPSGAFLDTLGVGPIPEPSTFMTLGIGLFVLLFWAAKRGKFHQSANLTSAARD